MRRAIGRRDCKFGITLIAFDIEAALAHRAVVRTNSTCSHHQDFYRMSFSAGCTASMTLCRTAMAESQAQPADCGGVRPVGKRAAGAVSRDCGRVRAARLLRL